MVEPVTTPFTAAMEMTRLLVAMGATIFTVTQEMTH
jgi:hypothetical protein